MAGHRPDRRGRAPARRRRARAPPTSTPPPTEDGEPDLVHACRRGRLGRDARAAARRGPARAVAGGRGAAAVQPVGDRAGPAARRPRRRSPASWPGRCRGSPSPAARFGTRFHAWVEARFGQQRPARPRRAARPRRRRHRRRRRPARADRGVRGRVRSPTGVPHAVEAPFALVLAGQVVRGRIDAVYADGRRRGCSWSSTGRPNRAETADPLQLAIYRRRLGRARRACRSSGCARRSTTCAPDHLVEPPDLPDRAALESWRSAPRWVSRPSGRARGRSRPSRRTSAPARQPWSPRR